MPNVNAAASSHQEWNPREKDVKSYLHFDRRLSAAELKEIATDDDRVARHPFFPMIRFKEEWIRFRKNGQKRLKSRPIRYSARIDAAIFAYHRWKLSKYYENYLFEKGISEIPIAYRKI
ncbi:MAG: hypothetical protein AAFY99_09640, partial [Pseudomonadota bacterium]